MTDDERTGSPPAILASDAERDHCVLLLREAVGEGRLTLEEFSDRVDLVRSSRTNEDLARVTADLPTQAPERVLTTGGRDPALADEQHLAFCSHLSRSGPWSLAARSAWRSIFGTIDLDLRQARLGGADTHLDVRNLFGTVTVIVPEGVEVVVRGGGFLASQRIESPRHPVIAGAPRITIETRGTGGTLVVRSAP